MSATVTYKGAQIASVENDTVTLETSGKWMEDNITIDVDVDIISGSVTVTDRTTTSITLTVDRQCSHVLMKSTSNNASYIYLIVDTVAVTGRSGSTAGSGTSGVVFGADSIAFGTTVFVAGGSARAYLYGTYDWWAW